MNVYEWSLNAKVGECIVYHGGGSPNLKVQEAALRAHEAGTVFLFQRRRETGFTYCAVRISPECKKALDKISAWWPKNYERRPREDDPGEANSRAHLNRRYG